MPPCTPWCPHLHDRGFDADTLRRVCTATDSALLQGYAGLLRANLRSNDERGPNAALLVAGAALQTGAPCRMWLNDIRNGHYGDAIPQLKKIEATARAIYEIEDDNRTSLQSMSRTLHIPNSMVDLASVLREWKPAATARLGFLDPMHYRMRDRRPAETSSADHRCWLALIALDGLTCAVQFTGNRIQPRLERDLHSLHDDAVAEGYTASRAFKRQNYVTFRALRSPVSEEPERIAAEIEERVRREWDSWRKAFACRRPWQLKTYRNGIAA